MHTNICSLTEVYLQPPLQIHGVCLPCALRGTPGTLQFELGRHFAMGSVPDPFDFNAECAIKSVVWYKGDGH